MQSSRGGTKLLQRHHFSISNTLRFTSASSSSSSWSANESKRLGFDSFRSTRDFDSAATYLISSLTKAVPSSSVVPKQNFTYSSRCFSTIGDSVQSTIQESPESASDDVPRRIKFKRLDKTAKHIMQIIDKEAVEEVRALKEIPEIKPGYIVQLKVNITGRRCSSSNLYANSSGNGLSSLTGDLKYGMSLLSNRKLSTLTPDSSDDVFPSDLLMKKTVITPDRTIGQYQDLVIPMTNFQNEEKGLMVLSGDVFDVPIRKDIIHNVVKWQLAKRQQGTHSTKTLSEVSGTGRKPWNQKGTGRARHGTLRGPQFRGGCVMHGPKPRSHAIKMNKQVRRLGLKIALSARAAEGKLLVFDDLALPSHKTKNIVNYYNQMENTKKVLVVEGGPIDEKLKLATQNLHYVNIIPSIGLNVYSILLHDTLVMSRDAVNKIVERMNTPINR